MGKGRGKGKKQSVIVKREELGNDEEDKDSARRRSGIQQKSLKDEIEEAEASGNVEDGVVNMKGKNCSTENTRKRKRSVLVKETIDPVKEEDVIRTKRNPDDDSKKPAGFRQNGSRRKSKPHRAAEAGVDCNLQSEIFI